LDITEDKLLAYNKRGLIPGPHEDVPSFLQRIESYKIRRDDFSEEGAIRETMKRAFDIDIDWIEVIYSNRGLAVWEGAAVFVSDKSVVFQMRNAFKKGRYLGIYEKGEVIAHEWVHLARAAFCEPQFEEVFAYRLSTSVFRRWVGPFFQASWESTAFLIFWLIASLAGMMEIFIPKASLFSLLPYSMTAVWIIRLAYKHVIFNKCAKKIGLLLEKEEILAFLLRLTDWEIRFFSRASLEEIREYALQQKSLRWRILNLSYALAAPQCSSFVETR
jgi:hypothetical protein